jgi:hypothetical protein
MKLLGFLSFFAAVSAFAAIPVETVWVNDGASIACEDKNDLIDTNTGGYRLKGSGVKILNSQTLEIEVELNFIRCVESLGNFNFVKDSPLGPYSFSTVSTGSELKVVAEVEEAYILVYQDGVYDVLSRTDLTNASKQTYKLKLDIQSITSELQRKSLSDGGEVIVSVDIHLNKEVNYLFENSNEDFRILGYYGAYRLNFPLMLGLDRNIEGVKLN